MAIDEELGAGEAVGVLVEHEALELIRFAIGEVPYEQLPSGLHGRQNVQRSLEEASEALTAGCLFDTQRDVLRIRAVRAAA